MLPAFLAQHPAIKLIVIDSVTFHFRQEYADMAARTRQLAQMAQQLMQLAGERDVAVGGAGWGRGGAAGLLGLFCLGSKQA
jgi:RAD51-like protein 2